MKVTMLAYTPNPEVVIEQCARVCYNSEDKMTMRNTCMGKDGLDLVPTASPSFLKALIKKGHLSVLEHAVATFRIEGISRACSHQLVRHRMASYAQMSQRYVKEEGFFAENKYVMPHSIGESEHLSNTLEDIEDTYKHLLEVKIPAEDARYVLPNAIHTTIVMTANFREWRHFLDLRGDKHAQWEIRKLAIEIWAYLKLIAPTIFGDYTRVLDDKAAEKGECGDEHCQLVRPTYLTPDAMIEVAGRQYLLRDLLNRE